MRGEPALNGANSHHKHTPITESPSHFGFSIADFRLSERDFEGNAFIGLFPVFQSKIQNRKSKMLFDDLVRPRQHIRLNLPILDFGFWILDFRSSDNSICFS
jgi:hypothetical protein